MNDGTLAGIVGVEKEIQEQVAAEEQQYGKLLEDVRLACVDDLRQAGRRLEQELEVAIDEARNQASQKAAEIVNKATAAATRLLNIDDSKLSATVARYLVALLPEGSYDRQDVEI